MYKQSAHKKSLPMIRLFVYRLPIINPVINKVPKSALLVTNSRENSLDSKNISEIGSLSLSLNVSVHEIEPERDFFVEYKEGTPTYTGVSGCLQQSGGYVFKEILHVGNDAFCR